MGVLMVGGSCKCMTFQKRGIFWKLVLVYFSSGWEEKHSTVRHILACQEIMYRLLFRTFHIGPKVVQLFAQSVLPNGLLSKTFQDLGEFQRESFERLFRRSHTDLILLRKMLEENRDTREPELVRHKWR
jgi:hypothetical protein